MWPLIRGDVLLRREDLHSHVTSLAKESAFFLDVLVWPAEELDDGTLLSLVVVVWLIDLWSLPDEVGGIHGDLELVAVSVCHLDLE